MAFPGLILMAANPRRVYDLAVGADAVTVSNAGDVAVNTDKFTVAGASGNTAVGGTLGVVGDVAVNTDKFTVAGASGNTAVGGTLGVVGDVAVNTDKFTVAGASGNTAVGGTLGVVGDVAVNTDKFTVAGASGNTAIAGTLGVTGAATLANTSIGGTLGLSGSGVNLLWKEAVGANRMDGVNGTPSKSTVEMYSGRSYAITWAFDKDSQEGVAFTVPMPPDYDGRAITIDLLWTATAGTTGGVTWQAFYGCFNDGDDMAVDLAAYSVAATDTFQGVKRLHKVTLGSVVPYGTDGSLLTILIRRVVAYVDDTFDADAHLIGAVLRIA